MSVYVRCENASLEFPLLGLETKQFVHTVSSMFQRNADTQSSREIKIVKALNGINLELKEGDKLGLIGHNGAGKTTLLKMINGIYHPTSGSCEVIGRVSSLLDMGLGMDENATGYENIFLASYLSGYDKPEIQTLLPDIVEFADIGDFIYLPMRTYSAGMRARLAFAIATAFIPDILVIDEVFGTGDADFVNKSIRRMEDLMTGARILIFASHSPDLVEQFCNKAILMEKGNIVKAGNVKEVNEFYQNRIKD